MNKEHNLKQKALVWWNGLTQLQKRDYEMKTYGYGDQFEDNSLNESDFINMYKKYFLNHEMNNSIHLMENNKSVKENITEILYKNSHDDSDCLRIKFENIEKVIDELSQILKQN